MTQPMTKPAAALASLAAIVVGVCLLILTGCTGQDDSGADAPSWIAPHHVVLPDGRTVLCVYEKQGYGGGPSCDWGNAK